VAGFITRDVLDEYDRSEDVEFLTESDVERSVTGALDGSV